MESEGPRRASAAPYRGHAKSPLRRSSFPGGALALLAVCLPAFAGPARSAPRAPSEPASERWTGLPAPPPGAEPFPPDLTRALARAWQELGSSERRGAARPRFFNRLLLAPGGYLRDHAFDPVDWRPWGEEAFAAARQLGRPVLLSIGYATCHWCHVLQAEAYSDPEFARRVNERYVAVLVDREERPEVDAAYQAAAEAFGERGGWPLTLWLTPEGTPFYVAGYLPRRDGESGFALGFDTLLARLADAWRDDRGRLERSATGLAAGLQAHLAAAPTPAAHPDWAGLYDRAVPRLLAVADPVSGGLIGTPKFPLALPVRALLRAHRRGGDPRALAAAELTLERVSAGALNDPLGGGFHRYATDAEWRRPHFEKPLVDNARLALAYLEGFAATGDVEYATVVRETLAFMTRELRLPGGTFAVALDADSLGADGVSREGAFYAWSVAAIEAALAPNERRAWWSVYELAPLGEGEALGVPFAARRKSEAAAALGIPAVELEALLTGARARLAAARTRRPTPARDETVVVGANGLAISAFARAALALEAPGLAETAAIAADELLRGAHRDGRLRHLANAGGSTVDALLDDYALLVAGLLDLHEATGEVRWLATARSLSEEMIVGFADPERGGFRQTRHAPRLTFAVPAPATDDLGPSGNAVAALDLLRLAAWSGDSRLRGRAEATLAGLSASLAERPESCGELFLALDFLLAEPPEIVVVTPGDRSAAAPFLAVLRSRYLPNRVLTVIPEREVAGAVETAALLAGRRALDGLPTAYVCRRFACQRPTVDPAEFARQLERLAPPASPGTPR